MSSARLFTTDLVAVRFLAVSVNVATTICVLTLTVCCLPVELPKYSARLFQCSFHITHTMVLWCWCNYLRFLGEKKLSAGSQLFIYRKDRTHGTVQQPKN